VVASHDLDFLMGWPNGCFVMDRAANSCLEGPADDGVCPERQHFDEAPEPGDSTPPSPAKTRR